MPGTAEFLTKQAWANRLGISTRTLNRALANGSLRGFRVGTAEGGRVMISEDDMADWLRTNPVHGGAQ
jgi:excisionase family DNA binding protein